MSDGYLCPLCGEMVIDGEHIVNENGELMCCRRCLLDMTQDEVVNLFGGHTR